MKLLVLTGVILLSGASGLMAQAPIAEPEEDDQIEVSGLFVEEAYIQERESVQHIATWTRGRGPGNSILTFEQEWPLWSEGHEFNLELSMLHGGGRLDFGNVDLGYRFQLIGGEDARIAVGPTLTLTLPTGARDRLSVENAAEMELMLPVSLRLADDLSAHSNVGVTLAPQDDTAEVGVSFGQSVVWRARSKLNLLFEVAVSEAESPLPGSDADQGDWTFSPGLQYAVGTRIRLVPGLAVPIRITGAGFQPSLLLYLSAEHSFRR